MRKSQPKIKIPALPLPPQQGSKVVSTPVELSAALHNPKQYNRHGDMVVGENSSLIPHTEAGPSSGWVNPSNNAVIRGGIDPKRIDSIGAHEDMHQMFGSIEEIYGKGARQAVVRHLLSHASPTAHAKIRQTLIGLGYKPQSSGFNEEILNYHHTYMTDPLNRKRIQDQSQSATKKLIVDRHIKQGYRRMVEAGAAMSHRDIARIIHAGQRRRAASTSMEHREAKASLIDLARAAEAGVRHATANMAKSIKNADWSKLVRRHMPSNSSVVDHSMHVEASPKSGHLDAVISHPEAQKPIPSKDMGISQKLIYNVPDKGGVPHHNQVMVKPYHKKLESKTKAYANLPITGWSTMATKGLYNASGIGHLAEDVHTNEHEGVPLTVHHFAKDFVPVADLVSSQQIMQGRRGISHSVDPLQYGQIAMMDYLTNNNDRHGANLMINPTTTDERGYSPILGIDHERSFQYNMTNQAAHNKWKVYPPSVTKYHKHDHPSNYSNHFSSAMHYLVHPNDRAFGAEGLQEWWKSNHQNIRNEMDKHLFALKDPAVRKHVAENFEQRYNAINQWASNPEVSDPFAEDSNFPAVRAQPFPGRYKEEVAQLLTRLPQDPAEAADTIVSGSQTPKSSRHQKILSEAMEHLTGKMTNDQLVHFVQKHHGNPGFNVKALLRSKEFATNEDRQDFHRKLSAVFENAPDAKRKFPFLRNIGRTEVE